MRSTHFCELRQRGIDHLLADIHNGDVLSCWIGEPVFSAVGQKLKRFQKLKQKWSIDKGAIK